MVVPIESTEWREHGHIVSWNAVGIGRIRADNGDRLLLFYSSVLHGFRQLKPGQRVEFSRGVGLNRNVASCVVADDSPPQDSDTTPS
jgi:cold shock CspA family protein